jgi:hypothetical protein
MNAALAVSSSTGAMNWLYRISVIGNAGASAEYHVSQR